MGAGDDIMATGMACGAADRGKRIAFGDGHKIKWGPFSKAIFHGNPNIAPPGAERASDIEWIHFYKGSRIYNKQGDGHWIWNHNFSPVQGELYFTKKEIAFAEQLGKGFIMIEPNVAAKPCAPNKQWEVARYQWVANKLKADGHRTIQPVYKGAKHRLEGVQPIETPDLRHAAALLARASLYIGGEGGLHHAAAAVDTRAVVMFGGWIPPTVTGYMIHTNLAGSDRFCGLFKACDHCKKAMDVIEAERVYQTAVEQLQWC